jgi:excisionase family DNA binding protein
MSDLFCLARMAGRLGVTQRWLREQADSGTIPCLKAGKRYLFNPLAVQEALATQAARSRASDRSSLAILEAVEVAND